MTPILLPPTHGRGRRGRKSPDRNLAVRPVLIASPAKPSRWLPRHPRRRLTTRSVMLAAVAMSLAPACQTRQETAEPVGVVLDQEVLTLTQQGAFAALAATAVDVEQRVIEGVSLRWWSSDPSVATVDLAGTVTAVGNGVARIWASVGVDSVFTVVVVDIPEPVVEFAVFPPRVRFSALGDATQLRLEPLAAAPESALPSDSLESYCRSANESVAVVAAGGFVTALGNGVTQVLCQVGESSGSLEVRVTQRAARVAIIAERDMWVSLEGDTLPLTLARVDSRNEPIPDAQATWASLDPDIVTVDASGVANGFALGQGRIVGELHGLADTAVIEVVAEGVATEVTRRPRIVARRPGRARAGSDVGRREGPARARGAATTLGARPVPDEGAFAKLPPDASLVYTRSLSLWTAVKHAEHRVDVGAGVEQTSGLLFGGGIKWALANRIELEGRGFVGKLTSDDPGVSDRTVNDLQLDVNLRALPWLTFTVGSGLRSYTTSVATQRWSSLRTGGEANLELIDGTLRAVFRGFVHPVISVSGLGQSPNLGLEAGAGMEYRSGKLMAGVYYGLERYDFPRVSGIDRREQFTTLRVRIGLDLGGGR
jgi:hypothetical protein